ncbi:uncharacterized protein LOC110267686 [Arachis ipaensis]|uniref:uncharacterized protein LOC110267686 n=1 Tax=Arachis ipaensis TaxID=130454 RepID=UPI000A2B0786|nr:uncharacterized protein LOC110267686 [Arachis ipaensis]XP_025684355.1 uncharacterized protein LOC112785132 [Arachis hypogaea]QHN80854.1 uncharacterized protein DS421_20g681760 [Arachis hypogaea]
MVPPPCLYRLKYKQIVERIHLVARIACIWPSTLSLPARSEVAAVLVWSSSQNAYFSRLTLSHGCWFVVMKISQTPADVIEQGVLLGVVMKKFNLLWHHFTTIVSSIIIMASI